MSGVSGNGREDMVYHRYPLGLVKIAWVVRRGGSFEGGKDRVCVGEEEEEEEGRGVFICRLCTLLRCIK